MLVLTRKLDELIMIGDGVEVKVLELSGNRVKLGITAPRDSAIRRISPEANEPGSIAGPRWCRPLLAK
jgi:carbon storage regulator CsrA